MKLYTMRRQSDEKFIMIAPIETICTYLSLHYIVKERILRECWQAGYCDLFGNGRHEDMRVRPFSQKHDIDFGR